MRPPIQDPSKPEVLATLEADKVSVDLEVLFEQGLDAIEPTDLEAFFAPEPEPDANQTEEKPIEN